METFYLDTNILIALSVTDGSLKKRSEIVINALDTFTDSDDVRMVTSTWALTEMVKVMINEYQMQPKKVATIHNSIRESSSLGGYEFEILEASPKGEYTAEDLLRSVGEIMVLYSPGWGDAFHAVIMRNHDIKNILSCDEKRDFKIVPGIRLVHPGKIKIETEK